MNSNLYHHESMDVYECMGCGEMLATPRFAVLTNGRRPEPVKDNPENRMMWLDLHGIDHKDCLNFNDEEKSKQHRERRRGLG